MRAPTRYLAVAAWLVAGSFGAAARAQQPPLPAAPVPVPPAGQALPPVILGQPLPPAATAPPPGLPPAFAPAVPPPLAPAPVPPAPGPAPPPDPGRDGWADIGLPSKPPGLFFDLEVDVLKPSVKNKLSATVMFPDGFTDTVHVPQESLGWTAAPTFEFGYRLPDSCGDLVFGYRFLVSEGRGNAETPFGNAAVKSRLDINEFNLDYATATYSPLPRYDLKFRIGVRLATVYLDSQASEAVAFERASSYFVGAGPSARVDFERRFQELPELGIFLRADGAVLIGQVRQKFSQSFGPAEEESAFLEAQKTQTAGLLRLQAGLIYHPFGIGNDRLRIAGGYQFERWWGVGKINGTVAPDNISSDAEVTAQGIFLRAEYDF
jgi:hypothetical protein